MDRQFAYAGAIPLETDILNTNKYAYVSIAELTQTILGTSTLVSGLTVIPTSPASLQVQAGAGVIYSLQNVDNTAYSTLPSDTTHQIVKQGINLNTTNLTCAAPGTAGQSINYLIEAIFTEVDALPVVLPYYNASNPSQAYSGPNNAGTTNNTIRQDTITLVAKAGTPATTGSQTTPAPDAGYVGLYVVTVANGQTQINSGNISVYSGAPLITETLTQKISQTTADARYVQSSTVQSGSLTYSADTGTANAYVATLSPVPSSLTVGMRIGLKIANNNTGACTVNPNGLGVKNIKRVDGTNPVAGDLITGQIADLEYDGTNFQLMNPATILSNTGGYASVTQLQSGSTTYAADTGTANNYVITLSPAPISYLAGNTYRVKILNANTGASTLNANSLGAKSCVDRAGNALVANDLVAGMVAEFKYDGTNMQLQRNMVPATTATGGYVTLGANSDVKTGTSTTLVAPISTLVNHRGVGKAWLLYNASTQSLLGSYNISSVTFNSTGNLTANYTTAFVNANYAIAGTSGPSPHDNIINPITLSTGSCNFQLWDTAGPGTANTTIVTFMAMGDQV